MADRICQYGNCQIFVPAGEGVNVAAAGWRVKFCGWKHAALWILDRGKRHEADGRDADLCRQAEEVLENKKVAI